MCYATLFMRLFFGLGRLDLSNLSPNHIDADLMIKQFMQLFDCYLALQCLKRLYLVDLVDQ